MVQQGTESYQLPLAAASRNAASAAAGVARCIRVGIADDHAIVRHGLSEFLREQASLEVAGLAASGREAMELARQVRLDVLLLDIDMPGLSGIDAITSIVAREDGPAVLVLSTHPPATYGVAMLQKGASGYLSKQCDPFEIVKAIHVVASGRRYLEGSLAELLLGSMMKNTDSAPHEKLTEREFTIFLRLATGKSVAQAAQELSLSQSTVAAYRVRIMRTMELQTNADLTFYALKKNLLS